MQQINVWISQTAAVKAEVESVKSGVVGKDIITGTKAEQKEYAMVASKIADKVDGLFSAPTIATKVMPLESLYLDSVDEIAALQKGGATILGVWNMDGSRIKDYPLHETLIDFMPRREVRDEEGNVIETLEPVYEDVVLVWGAQSPREFA